MCTLFASIASFVLGGALRLLNKFMANGFNKEGGMHWKMQMKRTFDTIGMKFNSFNIYCYSHQPAQVSSGLPKRNVLPSAIPRPPKKRKNWLRYVKEYVLSVSKPLIMENVSAKLEWMISCVTITGQPSALASCTSKNFWISPKFCETSKNYYTFLFPKIL